MGLATDCADNRNIIDEWPKSSNGDDWDGTGFLPLVHNGNNPFGPAWDAVELIKEVEVNLDTDVIDIPLVSFGANHYGFRFQLTDRPDIVARLSRGDINKPGYHIGAMEEQVMHDHFELATYDALEPLGGPLHCRPLYHRDPVKSCKEHDHPDQHRGISGRRLFLFQKAQGEAYDYGRWRALNNGQKNCLLIRSAQISARIFKYELPLEYSSAWIWKRIFGQHAEPCLVETTPTREFCYALLVSKIHAVLGEAGSLFTATGKEKDDTSLNATFACTRQALLELVPRILPKPRKQAAKDALYRFVLDHGDFGMHNMTVAMDSDRKPYITSVFDWEGGSVVPALLSEPKMVTTVDLIIDENGDPSIGRWGDGDSPDKMTEYRKWTKRYYKALFSETPEYKQVIKAGLDARRI